MGIFVIQRMFNTANIFSYFAERQESRQFMNGVKALSRDKTKLKEAVEQHDLKKIGNVENHIINNGGKVVKAAYALFTHSMLITDSIIKALPDTKQHANFLQRVKERNKGNREVENAIDTAVKKMKNMRVEIVKEADPELKTLYKRLLALMKAAKTEDRQTFVQHVMGLLKTSEGNMIEYWMVRIEEARQYKDLPRVKKNRDAIAKELKIIWSEVHGKDKKADTKNLVKRIGNINNKVEDIKKEVKDAFMNGYKIAMRSLIVAYTVLIYLNKLELSDEQFEKDHEIPKAMAVEMEKKIEKILTEEERDTAEEVKEVHAIEADLHYWATHQAA